MDAYVWMNNMNPGACFGVHNQNMSGLTINALFLVDG